MLLQGKELDLMGFLNARTPPSSSLSKILRHTELSLVGRPFYEIGMKVYDRLAGKLGLAPSRHLSIDETLEAIPTVEQANLPGSVIYQDG